MTRLEARAHWQKCVAEWTAWAEAFQADVLAVEDDLLRFAIAAIADIVASGHGAVAIRRVNDVKVGVVGFFLEEEFTEPLLANLWREGAENPKEALAQAEQWIRARLDKASILAVAWAFRHFQNMDLNRSSRFRTLEHHGIIFDVPSGRFTGVRYDGGIWRIPG